MKPNGPPTDCHPPRSLTATNLIGGMVMAELHPIDSSSDPQAEPLPQTTDMLTDLRILSRRLKKSLNAVHRLKVQVYAEKSRPEEAEKTSVLEAKGKTSPTEQGEYRTYFVSTLHRETEKEYFFRFNVGSLTELLEIPSNILESYCSLLKKLDIQDDPDSLLYPMGRVLEIALDAVACAIELCDYQERPTV